MKTIKRVRNIRKYIHSSLKKFRIASPKITEEYKKLLEISNIQEGMSFVPKIIGPVTKSNVEGYYILRKDLPKENRFICEHEWRLLDWGKHEHTGTVSIYRDCYPRDFVEPYETEIIVHGDRFISTELNRENENEIRHVMNMFAEIFGGFEVLTEDFKKIPIIHCNFEILPPGEYPFEKIKEYLLKDKRKGCMSKEILQERLDFYENFDVKEYIIGNNGYQGYFGFVIKNKTVFDNNRYANAIYIFDLKSTELCKYTKKEVLENNFCTDRIVHGKNWKQELEKVLLKYNIKRKDTLDLF